jgi:homoserine kinase type II
MAVYTHVPVDELAALLARYDGVGTLLSAKGIAEGVENSNYFIATTAGRFILTLYEKRVDVGDLPFFLALTDHLAERGLPVPRALKDRNGLQIQTVAGRSACLIEFLDGVSLDRPTPVQARAAGEALGKMHAALADFTHERTNALGHAGWRPLAERCGAQLDDIHPGLRARVAEELDYLAPRWPRDLPTGVIHADLFPDNVLMMGDRVGGLIDFYFACTDIRAYDLAITHAAWCFNKDGTGYNPEIGAALVEGYERHRPLSEAEKAAAPVLARGACLRFLLTRAWDWVNTPADALVRPHDPIAFLRRLDFYTAACA